MKNLKKILVVSGLVVFMSLLFVHQAHAGFLDLPSPNDFLKAVFGWFSSVIISIGTFFGMILAWAVSWILAFGQNVVNSAPVQAGYATTLAIANLGFVLGIIIVGVATILRSQQYGVKQLLYKIVVMAVMVNFGLVISGALLNFSDSLTNYYLKSLTGASDASASYSAFRDRMFGAFQPQKFMVLDGNLASSTAAASSLDPKSNPDGGFLQTFMSFAMSLVGMVMINITLATFVIMLTIRYVWIVILLMTLPIAWMASVFPQTSSWNGKWWGKFTKQLLFPPVALFFLWLAIMVSRNTIAISGTDSDPLVGSLSKNAPIASSIVGPLFNVVVLAFLMIGGLMAADSLGGEGASMGLKWAHGARDWALGKAAKGGRRVGGVLTEAARRRGGQLATTKAGATAAGFLQSRIGKVATLGLGGAIGRGLETMRRAPEASLDEAKKKVSSLDAVQVRNQIQTATGTDLTALLDRAKKTGNLGDILKDEKIKERVGKMSGQEFTTLMKQAQEGGYAGDLLSNPKIADKLMAGGSEDLFKRVGAGSAYEEMMNSSGLGLRKDVAARESLDQTDPVKYKEELDKINGQIKKRIAKLSEDSAAKILKAADSKSGENYMGMEQAEMQRVQQELARGISASGGWGAGKFGQLMQKMDSDKAYAEFGEINEKAGVAEVNGAIKGYLNGNAAKALGLAQEKIYSSAANATPAPAPSAPRPPETPDESVDVLARAQQQGKAERSGLIT